MPALVQRRIECFVWASEGALVSLRTGVGMVRTLRVLLVEDSEDDALLLLRELKRSGYEPDYERVDTAPGMEAALDARDWELVISDHSMPTFSSSSALQLLQRKGLDLPFIIVSGNIGEEVAVAAMRAGAHDYIMKGNLARLGAAIEGIFRTSVEGRFLVANPALARMF